MARDWVELHKTIDPNIFDGISEFTNQDDDLVPQSNPNSRVSYLETTGRVDGPFAGRQYVRNTNSWQDTPIPPTPPPTRLETLQADDESDKATEDTLLAKDPATWTQTDRDTASQMQLRKGEINRLK